MNMAHPTTRSSASDLSIHFPLPQPQEGGQDAPLGACGHQQTGEKRQEILTPLRETEPANEEQTDTLRQLQELIVAGVVAGRRLSALQK